MTDTDDVLESISHAASRLVPQLTERLRRHGLGEIEVESGDLRLRVTAGSGGGTPAASVAPASAASTPSADGSASSTGATAPPSVDAVPVASPAVGFFVYADGLGPGLEVAKGDALGHVEMLGVRHDVRAPRGGTVRNLVAESGEPVEYGQVVVELESGEPAR